jgi:very-short-patch-repair endonuclease
MISARQLVDRFGGIARSKQLAPFGFSRYRLDCAARAGEIDRIRSGVFATASASSPALSAAAHGGALTCSAALRHRGVWVLNDDSSPHVWMGRAGRAHPHKRCACTVHYRPGRMTLGVADIEHALVHAHECHGDEFFFAAFESAWNKRLIGAGERSRIRAALPASARWLVDLARGNAESGLESLVRLRLYLLGIDVETQVDIPGVGRVDFVIDGRLIIEADGRENHEGGENRQKDLRRDAAASALGYESLRFDYWQIIDEWDQILPAILAALARARA